MTDQRGAMDDDTDLDDVAAREWELREQQERARRAGATSRRSYETDHHTWLYMGVLSLVVHAAIARSFTEAFLVHVTLVVVGSLVALVGAVARHR